MKPTFFARRRIRQGLTLVLLAGALTCMFPPPCAAFRWWAAHAAGVAFGYLLLGIAFLIVDRTRLMFVCLGCSAAIGFYFNEAASPPRTVPHSYRPADPVPAEKQYLLRHEHFAWPTAQ